MRCRLEMREVVVVRMLEYQVDMFGRVVEVVRPPLCCQSVGADRRAACGVVVKMEEEMWDCFVGANGLCYILSWLDVRIEDGLAVEKKKE